MMEMKAKRFKQANGFDDMSQYQMTDYGNEDVRKCQSSAKCRLFVGNLTPEVNKDHLEQLFGKFGAIVEFYFSEKGFAFVRYDDRSSAEAAKLQLDDYPYCGRSLRIRYAANNCALLVKELSPYVSNELLYDSFSAFGDVVRAVHIVDDHGKPVGEGIVEFSRKQLATEALKRVNEGMMLLCDNGKPIVAEMYEPKDEDDGLPERVITKNNACIRQRQVPPHFARPGSFEFEFGGRWKKLYDLEKEKREELDKQLKEERGKLEAEMDAARQKHEAKLQREADMQRQQEIEESHRQHMEMMNSMMLMSPEPGYPMHPQMGGFPPGAEFHSRGSPMMPSMYGPMGNESMTMPRNLPMQGYRAAGMRGGPPTDIFGPPMQPRYSPNSAGYPNAPFRQPSYDMRSQRPGSSFYNSSPAGGYRKIMKR